MNKYELMYKRFKERDLTHSDDLAHCLELVERATPKKPFIDFYGSLDNYCPSCHSKRPIILTNINARPKYCPNCGQALDWNAT